MEHEAIGCTEDTQHTAARLSLREIAERFASPLTEEHAWAVLYQLVQKFARQNGRESFDGSSRDLCYKFKCSDPTYPPAVALTLEAVMMSEDGLVYFEEDKSTANRQDDNTPIRGVEHKKILADLGCLLYLLLDHGIPEDQERSLSLQMSNLIEWLVTDQDSSSEGGSIEGNLDDEPYLTNDSGITEDEPATLEEGILYITKACECHVFDVPSPEAHYRALCRSLVEEAMAIHEMKEDRENERQQTTNLNKERWRKVMEQIKIGVKLHQVPETEKATKKMVSIRLSDYDLLLMQISKYDKTKLKKATTVDCLPLQWLSLSGEHSKSKRCGRRATVGDVHSSLMNEIKSHPTLKPASKRALRPVSLAPRSLSPMESLMEEILTPPALKRVERKSPRRQSLYEQSSRLCKSFSDFTELTSTPTTPPLIPFPSANDLDRADWERSISYNSETFNESSNNHMTDSDNEEEGVEDVFGNPVISLSPPDDEQTENSQDDSFTTCIASSSRLNGNTADDERQKDPATLHASNESQRQKLDVSCTKLTLDEVVQIRSVAAKAELIELQVEDMTLFWEVWKKKVCFQCRKSRFSCLRRSFSCHACKRLICSRCITKIFSSKKNGVSICKDVWYICQFCWNFTLQFSTSSIFDH